MVRKKGNFILALILWLIFASITFAGTVTYQYDSLNRLIGAAYPDGTVVQYTYDAAGNRLSKVVTIALVPDIKANGSDGPITVSPSDPVSIEVSLDPGDKEGQNADWWIAATTPFAPPGDWYSYVYPTGWFPGINLCIQTPLFTLSPFEVLNMVLPSGEYTFYFAVDPPDGSPEGPWYGMDSVEVRVE